jgi:hypothetical protein
MGVNINQDQKPEKEVKQKNIDVNKMKQEDIKEIKLSFNYWIKGLKEFYLKLGFKGIKEPAGTHIQIYKRFRKSNKK